MSRRVSVRVPLLALALVAVACGGDGSEPAGSAGVTTTAETSSSAGTVARPDEPTTTAAPAAPTTSTESTVGPRGDTTTTDAPASTTTDAPDGECRRLTEFDEADLWAIVNDGVMGGQSAGAMTFVESTMRFTGTVVTAGGGFTSVRHPLDGELAGSERLVFRVRVDDRTYAVTLESDATAGGRSVSYGADLRTDGPTDADGWQVVSVAYGDLRSTVFGTPVDAPPFDADAAVEIGIIIADGIDGPFALDVDWIDVCD